MSKRLTPIEIAIAGQPQDRRRRYEKRIQERGLVVVRVVVPADQAEKIRSLAQELRDAATDAGHHDD